MTFIFTTVQAPCCAAWHALPIGTWMAVLQRNALPRTTIASPIAQTVSSVRGTKALRTRVKSALLVSLAITQVLPNQTPATNAPLAHTLHYQA